MRREINEKCTLVGNKNDAPTNSWIAGTGGTAKPSRNTWPPDQLVTLLGPGLMNPLIFR